MAKKTCLLFKDQAYFTPKDIITWMKFYILSEEAFIEAFPEAYEEIAHNFFWDQHLGYGGLAGDSFNLDKFLNDDNIDAFSAIVANILARHSLSKEEIYAKVSTSEKLKEFERAKVNLFLAENLYFEDPLAVKKHFELLQRALQKRSFYELADIRMEDLEGEWISTAETSALDYNYNMTDFMALGSRVRLLISKYDERFYMSTWLVRVCDYTTREELDFAVRQTYVTLEDGYLSHYYKGKEGFDFSFRSPVFDYSGDTLKTQFWDVGFTFQRK
ncbi:hypothetical protein HYN59_03680 [Flavobacterium album]|uniref:Uncharacterized protein n=1 Tax=Flavobacterium album TaxID=2175091 RepID=A0A2S1QV21_9FLAO|nr:hypothetical protein [Flavobacterium album]AWH84268.1 hypothetical protein HYN59_03680 [Flavobacterium album]